MIQIKLRLFASLVKFGPVAGAAAGVPLVFELPERATVAELLMRLKIPAAEVKIVFVNGRNQPAEHVLDNGDEVGVFPLIGGG